ncbi:MAG: bifunctional hydroxymethylpyrimidine kinase/phosphomethylpyrimidine kinase [Chlorobium sp.]|uniref:bifunctional hydroxymethylpyrimidine kinase/phosphomethylpyrimidine kinase n=1 Tax=Chlorobium sp. TaxID=1095 RepID=UPI0025C0EA71|nr:bifunctional hydroxymethylpyrimidine kinase/phosphomethylpyrimidine kinase [Chlorobium sp.]MCF8382895.1 bifunctional hydroxymethylpyrimidine kinase/phosphomethylpyrimidine kinase [Chlorobium sp.]
MRYKTVLTIAGSDGSGGAGIQADLKTFAALDCYGVSVITAVTAQNTLGVADCFEMPVSNIKVQLETILGDIPVDAVKIGMLGSVAIIRTVAGMLKKIEAPVVLDTVLQSSSGRELLKRNALPVLIEELFPLARLITPNIPESALLLGEKRLPSTEKEIEQTARMLQQMGASSVLVKGGHQKGDRCSDCLISNNRISWFSTEKITTRNTHGTGCTLSSAVAAFLAGGMPLESAVEKAKAYTFEAIRAGAAFQLGKGSGPLHHCYRFWK